MVDKPLLDRLDDSILPVVDRNAPVLERVRERRAMRTSPSIMVADEMATSILSGDDEQKAELADEAMKDFRTQMAESLGVEPEKIADDIVEAYGSIFAMSESDVVEDTSLEERLEEDLGEEDEEGDGEEDNEDEDSGTSFS